MIGQTIAIFVDAYRELNARSLFWITLALSAVVTVAFAFLGWDAKGLSIATLHLPTQEGRYLYNWAFRYIVIGVWLTWVASILALVSSAGIFPEFLRDGSVDLFLAKPISRARLFLTKYLAGLLFVALQVLVVASGSYLALGLRGHEWRLRVFLAVPIVVCFFSYLFAICVLVGVRTRSAIPALILAIVCWTVFAAVDRLEPYILTLANVYRVQATEQHENIESNEANLKHAQRDPNQAAMIPVFTSNLDSARRDAEVSDKWAWWIGMVHRVVYPIKMIVPKTADTIGYLDAGMFSKEEMETQADRDLERRMGASGPMGLDAKEFSAAKSTERDVNARSKVWIIGTSLAFEVVIVGAAMWIFCRRDY